MSTVRKHKLLTSSSFEPVHSVHCLAALDLWAGLGKTIDCLIIQNGQGVQSMGRSMDWTCLVFCATLISCRSGHTQFVQTRAETFDTGTEAVEPGSRCQWHSQEFCSGWVNHLMYVRLFLPFISEQLKIGIKHQ